MGFKICLNSIELIELYLHADEKLCKYPCMVTCRPFVERVHKSFEGDEGHDLLDDEDDYNKEYEEISEDSKEVCEECKEVSEELSEEEFCENCNDCTLTSFTEKGLLKSKTVIDTTTMYNNRNKISLKSDEEYNETTDVPSCYIFFTHSKMDATTLLHGFKHGLEKNYYFDYHVSIYPQPLSPDKFPTILPLHTARTSVYFVYDMQQNDVITIFERNPGSVGYLINELPPHTFKRYDKYARSMNIYIPRYIFKSKALREDASCKEQYAT